MREIGRRLTDGIVSLVYPAECRVCGGPAGSLRDGVACPACWAEFDAARDGEATCLRCGVVLPGRFERYADQSPGCGRCGDLAFDLARACGPYEGALRHCVLELKTKPHFPARLRRMAVDTCDEILRSMRIDSIIPVPLHIERLADRRFNQAEVIARAIAEETAVPLDLSSTVRTKRTQRHRSGMSPIERSKSLRGAFHVRAGRLVRDRSILVVDDVMTTGSTVHEAALALRKAGATSVSVLALARARIYD